MPHAQPVKVVLWDILHCVVSALVAVAFHGYLDFCLAQLCNQPVLACMQLQADADCTYTHAIYLYCMS